MRTQELPALQTFTETALLNTPIDSQFFFFSLHSYLITPIRSFKETVDIENYVQLWLLETFKQYCTYIEKLTIIDTNLFTIVTNLYKIIFLNIF